MSFNVGGILVSDRAGRTRITQQAVARAIETYWTKRGAKLDRKSPRDIEPLSIANGNERLGYAVLAPAGGWIAVADSERYHADHALAQHLAKALEVEVLWYTLYGATNAGIAQWFGSKRKAPPKRYDAVEEHVQEYSNACVYFDQLGKAEGAELVGFTGVTEALYTIGPVPGEDGDEDEEEDGGDEDDTTDGPSGGAVALDTSQRAPFEPIRIKNRKGTHVAGRDTLSLGFSCRVEIKKISAAALALLDAYVATVPATALRWSLLGSNSSTISPVKLARARGMLDPKGQVAGKDVYFFLHGDDADADTAPAWLFLCSGKADVKSRKMAWGELRPTTLLELRFPSDFLWQLGADRFVELAARFAALVPYESGFCSIEISWSPLLSTISQDAPRYAPPHLDAHPGLGMHHDPNTLGGHCRGAHWLTLLGPDLVKKLGGRAKLAKAVGPSVGVIDAGDGVILRAGAAPLPDLTPADRAARESVARAVLPVTLFACDNRASFDDDDVRDTWLYRFVPDAKRSAE